MNKFYVKDVEWIRDETFFVKVNHLPSRVSVKVDGLNFCSSSGEWTQAILSALHQLQEKVNKHYEKNDDGLRLTKDYVDNQMDIRKDENFLDEMDKIEIRTKALELAIASCGNRIGDVESYVILSIAKHFYTYITKGE